MLRLVLLPGFGHPIFLCRLLYCFCFYQNAFTAFQILNYTVFVWAMRSVHCPGRETITAQPLMLAIDPFGTHNIILNVIVFQIGTRHTTNPSITWRWTPIQITYLEESVVPAAITVQVSHSWSVELGLVLHNADPRSNLVVREVVYFF